jgi:hypothetical protein
MPETMTISAYWMQSRDDYGRRVQTLITHDGARSLGVVVTIPRRTAPMLGYTHLSNDWTADLDAPGKVSHHRSLPAAKHHLERVHGAVVPEWQR